MQESQQMSRPHVFVLEEELWQKIDIGCNLSPERGFTKMKFPLNSKKKSKVHLKYSFYHTHTPPPPPPPLFPLFTSFEPVLCKCESPTNLQTMQGSKFIQRKLLLIKRSVHQDKPMQQRKDEKIIKGKKPAQGWIINVNEHAAGVVWKKGKNAILSN